MGIRLPGRKRIYPIPYIDARSSDDLVALMSFVNPAVLAGLALIAVPVLLHMLMKARPKKVIFPALQLIQASRKTSSRRLRLRHLLLLLMRMAVLALFIIAVARPSLPPASYAPNLIESATILILSGIAVGGYWLLNRRLQSRRLPAHELRYKQTVLKTLTTVACLVLLLLAVGWPYQQRIAAEIAEPLPEVAESLPVAAVFVFDTSTSMAYRMENETRLEVARRIAIEHLSRLPRQSRVAVISTTEESDAPLVSDLSAAQARIENLQISDSVIPLDQCILSAAELLKDAREGNGSEDAPAAESRFLHEAYVFTDMARSAWPGRPSDRLRERLEEYEWLQTYLIDTGVVDSENLGVARIRLSNQQPPMTAELIVTAELVGRQSGPLGSVELMLPDETGELVKRDQKLLPATDGNASPSDRFEVQFFVRNLEAGLNQAEVRLTGGDPLPADDRAYFTIQVGKPVRILVIADRKSEATLWSNALAPEELAKLERAPYQVVYQKPATAVGTRLRNYDMVCMLNVGRPSEALWTAVYDFVKDGGGLFVTYGTPELDIRSYLNPTARKLLPAEPLGAIKFREPEYLDIANTSIHPLFGVYDELGGVGELTAAAINRCWSVEPIEGSRVICSYTNLNGNPALIERSVGDGRSMVLTTALKAGDWSELVRARWSYVAFADQIAQYLTARSENQLNFIAGMPVAVRVESADRDRSYRLRTPGFDQTRGELGAHESSIRIDDCFKAGQYQLLVGKGDDVDLVGFSANRPDDESDLTRIDETQLDEFLGEEHYSISADLGELDRTVRQARLGQEVYPWIVTLLVLLFCTEHLVANRFYDEPQGRNDEEEQQADSETGSKQATTPLTASST